MRILVVGAGGFIGTALCAHLEAHGHIVHRVSSRTQAGIDPLSGRLPSGFRVPSGTEAVAYLAQSPRWRDGVQAAAHVLGVNVTSAVEMAAAACRAGAARFLYTSTGNVYEPCFAPLSEAAPVRRDDLYALSKIQAEEALGLFKAELDVVVTRLFGVYGPGQQGRLVPNLVASVAEDRPVRIDARPDIENDVDGLRVSLLYIQDAVELVTTALQDGAPALLNLAAPEPASIRSIAEAAGRALERMPIFEFGATPRRGDSVADVSRMLAYCGDRPFTRLDEGVRRVAAERA